MNLNSSLNIAFLSKEERDRGEVDKGTEISIYADGTKLYKRVGDDDFSAKLDTGIAFR